MMGMGVGVCVYVKEIYLTLTKREYFPKESVKEIYRLLIDGRMMCR